MRVQSHAYRTDLMFVRFDGEVLDRPHYIAARSPRNPGFYWGTFLLFDRPPLPSDRVRWEDLFFREFSHHRDIRHASFGWDCPAGELGASSVFEQRGYSLISEEVLAIDAPKPAAPAPAGIEVRQVTPDDWDAVCRLNLSCDPNDGADDAYGLFKERLRDRYRRMVEAGRGIWLGAFAGTALVAQLGLFFEEGLGRFQSVETDERFRRRGICEALVRRATAIGLKAHRARRLVIVAEDRSSAGRIYRRAGFAPLERQVGLFTPQLTS